MAYLTHCNGFSAYQMHRTPNFIKTQELIQDNHGSQLSMKKQIALFPSTIMNFNSTVSNE